MKNTITAILLAAAVSLTFPGTTFAKKGSSGWLPVPEFNAYVAERKEAGFWRSGYWVTSVHGRYKDGKAEYILRYESSPSDGGFTQSWCYGLDKEQFAKRARECKKRGLERMHIQSFELPSGAKLYQGVWQSQE